MKNQKETIRKMVGYLNNPEKDGGFWLPNIQRPFVWNEGQIERLFDSIMREYPISTLLVWKTKSNIRRRKFIDNYKHGLRLTDFYVPADNKTKMLVLDGQQRLQSLFIGLKGSYEKKELYFDILSGELVAPEDIMFRFKFIESEKAKLPWVKFKDLVFSTDEYDEISENIITSFDRELTIDEKKTIRKNVARIVRVFQTEENIVYQELDSVDKPNLYIARETIFDQYYGSKNIHLIFNIWYKDFNYHPSFQNNSSQVDHIFPQSLLKSVKIQNPNTGRRDVLKYKWWDRDQIANLMLLTQQENGAGGKSDTSPEEWFKDKSDDYLDLHLIPKDKELWKLENYEKFIEERKKLIEKKFSYLIIKEN
jgi:hypothetical protein